MREAVFARDGGVCADCREQQTVWEMDHVTPSCDGGTDDLANLRTLCRPCHAVYTNALVSQRTKERADLMFHAKIALGVLR